MARLLDCKTIYVQALTKSNTKYQFLLISQTKDKFIKIAGPSHKVKLTQ